MCVNTNKMINESENKISFMNNSGLCRTLKFRVLDIKSPQRRHYRDFKCKVGLEFSVISMELYLLSIS